MEKREYTPIYWTAKPRKLIRARWFWSKTPEIAIPYPEYETSRLDALYEHTKNPPELRPQPLFLANNTHHILLHINTSISAPHLSTDNDNDNSSDSNSGNSAFSQGKTATSTATSTSTSTSTSASTSASVSASGGLLEVEGMFQYRNDGRSSTPRRVLRVHPHTTAALEEERENMKAFFAENGGGEGAGAGVESEVMNDLDASKYDVNIDTHQYRSSRSEADAGADTGIVLY
jgi:hypothetical protein